MIALTPFGERAVVLALTVIAILATVNAWRHRGRIQ